MTLESKYKPGDEVTIKAIGRKGHIDSIEWDLNGTMYRVVYWDNCTRQAVWMYDWEIE